MSTPPVPRVNILGVGVSAINMSQALDQISFWIDNRLTAYVVVCPVYTVMVSQADPDHRRIVNEAGLVTPDGMPLVFLGRQMGHPDMDRVYGPDLMLAVSYLSAARGYRNYYYGGAEGCADELAEALSQRFYGLTIAGTYSPPFRALAPEEEDAVAALINAAQPDIVWVGLGSPKQDFWMARFREKLDAPVLIGVGAAFDFLTGHVPQAPVWMRRHALEWAFRLYHEPRRLWQRYLVYNPLFILYMALQAIGLRRIPLDKE